LYYLQNDICYLLGKLPIHNQTALAESNYQLRKMMLYYGDVDVSPPLIETKMDKHESLT